MTTTTATATNTNQQLSVLHLPLPHKNTSTASHDHNKLQQQTNSTSTSVSGKVGVRQHQQQKVKLPNYVERCHAAMVAATTPKDQQHKRPKLFVPRQLSDFGVDGGAYPEIHVAQYPRHMGNPHLQKKSRPNTSTSTTSGSAAAAPIVNHSSALVNVEIDETGAISYDAIVKGGTNSDKLVYTKLDDMKGGKAVLDDIALPTQEEEDIETARTNAALQALVMKKTAYDKPSSTAMINAATSQNIESKTNFIKYTARPDAPGYNPTASTRIIQMVPAKLDPLMPPKHKHVKAPRGPAEDPIPVLHAPPTKLTKEEQEAWNIPTCISNWKNPRGYTIPLDKRLAADGRGLLSNNEINTNNFAALAESLTIAERQARQEVRLRAITQQKLVMAQTEEREAALRLSAQQARLERSAGTMGGTSGGPVSTNIHPDKRPENSALPNEDDESLDSEASSNSDNNNSNDRNYHRNNNISSREKPPPSDGSAVKIPYNDTEEDVAARQREKLRMERKKERERELRYEANMELKKKQRLEEERDVSEKIALGVNVHATGTGGGIENVDSRLYNQTAGMDSGFGPDDEYNTYSKPLFGGSGNGGNSSSIYRPTRGETEYNADEQYEKLRTEGTTSKFQPHKGFGGADNPVQGVGSRTEPVQFEKVHPK